MIKVSGFSKDTIQELLKILKAVPFHHVPGYFVIFYSAGMIASLCPYWTWKQTNLSLMINSQFKIIQMNIEKWRIVNL